MTHPFAGITASQLKAVVVLKEKIESLEKELAALFAVPPAVPPPAPTAAAPEPVKKRQISAAGKARIAAAQKARWAKQKQAKAAKPTVKAAAKPAVKAVVKPVVKPKRRLSPEGRRRIIEATKARWAKIRAAAGKKPA